MGEVIKRKAKHNIQRLTISLKWIAFSILSGILIGMVSSAFFYCLKFVTDERQKHPWIIFMLPLGGVMIVLLYRMLHNENDSGTNLIISAIHSNAEVPLRMAPSIFISTIITHLFGGSAGREGAALQLGGSIGNSLGKAFKFNAKDKHIMIMCGMSASFSALFGTPMAAAIFSMEVISVGIMHYAALLPCVISSLVAHGVATYFGISQESFFLSNIPNFNISSAIKISILAVLCALISVIFCIMLHRSEHYYKKYFKNPYIRISVGGVIIIILTLIVGDQTYNGAGIGTISQCINGSVNYEAFILKMLFTVLTLGAGYKGGEIVPSFFIGASFGCLFGQFIDFNPSLCTAIGMTAVFCGVTNCPITSLLISFELFGYEGMPYFLLAIAFSYVLSGYYGLYKSQKIMYSKYRTNYINKKTE